MTIESVTYIDDLNTSYPAGTDVKSEGDNHIRNIKTAIKATFPSIDGPVTATQDELNLLDGRAALGFTLKGFTTYTSGSGTYTVPANVKAIYVELIGGGGGAGGVDGDGGGNCAVSSGGGGGGYCAKLITSLETTYSYAVGAGGAGGVGNADGTNGGNTTFSGGAVSMTAAGGPKSNGQAAAGFTYSQSLAAGTTSGGDINLAPAPSEYASSTAGALAGFPNSGPGMGPYGGPPTKCAPGANGSAGAAYGGGGGGAYASPVDASAYTGGTGAAGLVRITEYY